MGAFGILTGIWIFSLVLSCPMLFVKRLEVKTSDKLQLLGIQYVAFCVEDWRGLENGRAYYSAISLFVQYLLPIFIVSAAYLRIYLKLQNRMPLSNRGGSTTATSGPTAESERDRERERRMRRTNYLLISIAAIFGISWLPLNIFNLVAELVELEIDTQTFYITYAVCHMMGMSSACSNPLLYGWLNDNFRKEFNEIICCGRDSSYAHPSIRSHSKNKTMPENSKANFNTMENNLQYESAVTENGLQTELTVLVRFLFNYF